ncbi:hypothetical protein [Kocuria flava]|uniref:hypothetical protein n=1 Tax=Kocuria flava TaxID=446860 RepID=UPI002F9520CC
MMISALRIVGATSVVALVATGCSDGATETEAAESTETPTAASSSPGSTPSAEVEKPDHVVCVEKAVSSDTTSQLPVLEADQSTELLAEDVVAALNSWFDAGGQIVEECWSREDGDIALRETLAAIAQEYKEPYAEALLVEDFDSLWRDNPRQLHTEDLAVIHQNQLYRAQGDTWSIAGPIAEAYDITYEQTAPATFHTSPTGLLIPIQMTHNPLPSFMREHPVGTINVISQYDDDRVRIVDLQIG